MNKESLYQLLQLNSEANAPEFIIYSPTTTERLNFTCHFIFKHEFNCNYSITNNLSEFNGSNAIKINYSNQVIPNAFRITPHQLLFERGINDTYKLSCLLLKEGPRFFSNEKNCNLGYDIFSSVFYFISRYQEWQPFAKDKHERFDLENSIQFEFGFHLKPVVNYWIQELKKALNVVYNEIQFPAKYFKYISTIDVDNLYAYKGKGSARTLGGIAKDVATLNFGNLRKRISVLQKKEKDPFDVYDEVIKLSKDYSVPLICFFLQRNNTSYDRTIHPTSSEYKKIFDKLNANAISFGLHPSYFSYNNEMKMKEEFDFIERSAEKKINLSRQHYLRFNISVTPNYLMKNGVIADFTMGFASGAGYRAGTFTPFNYYDFANEKATELLLVPFAVMDGVYFVYSEKKASQAEEEMMQMAQEVRKLNGTFITVFHERTFDNAICKGFGTIYNNLHQKLSPNSH